MKISEMFYSVQGEGIRTGVLSAWIRFASCNLRCKGFFQQDPTNPKTYKDPLNGCDPKQYKTLFDLPVMNYGCDTIYAIDPRFKHLFKDYTVEDVVNEIRNMLPGGQWQHPVTGNWADLCITGGEPMLWQNEMIEIITQLTPDIVQIETNGTKPMSEDFYRWYWYKNEDTGICWNISPKLFNVSGEADEKAWKPEIISSYYESEPFGCLKFVVNNRPETWIELNNKVKYLKENGVTYPVYLMPVGATYEQQTDVKYLSEIAAKAIDNGYHLTSRLQSIFFGNTVGT